MSNIFAYNRELKKGGKCDTCPVDVNRTCGVFIGLHIESDKEGMVTYCNRRNYYRQERGLDPKNKEMLK